LFGCGISKPKLNGSRQIFTYPADEILFSFSWTFYDRQNVMDLIIDTNFWWRVSYVSQRTWTYGRFINID